VPTGALRRAAATLILAASLAGPPAEAADIVLLTEENYPYSYTDRSTGKVAGIGSRIVLTLVERAGISHDVRVMPWQRAFHQTSSQPNTCLFVVNETPERRPLFEWVGPLLEGNWGLFAPKDWPSEIGDLSELANYSIGVQTNSALETFLRGLKVGKIVPLANGMNFRMLEARRFDLIATGLTNGFLQAREAGVEVRLVRILAKASLSMACHPATDPDLLDRMRRALESMRGDGTLHSLASSRPTS